MLSNTNKDKLLWKSLNSKALKVFKSTEKAFLIELLKLCFYFNCQLEGSEKWSLRTFNDKWIWFMIW